MKSSGSDQELMSAVGAGSVDAFGQLYDRFCDRAYGVAQSVCRDEGSAQDAVQDAFLSIWKNRTSYMTERGTVAGLLLTVVRYRAVDLARINGRHAAYWTSADRVDERRAPDDVSGTIIERDIADRLRASLARLPDEQREVIALAYYGQLTHTEIASQLRLSPGTVKGRVRLGLEKLRRSMNQAAA